MSVEEDELRKFDSARRVGGLVILLLLIGGGVWFWVEQRNEDRRFKNERINGRRQAILQELNRLQYGDSARAILHGPETSMETLVRWDEYNRRAPGLKDELRQLDAAQAELR